MKEIIKLIEEKKIKYNGQMGFVIGNVSVRDIMDELIRDIENLTKHNSQTIQSFIKDDRPCKRCGKKLSEHSYFYDSCKYKPADWTFIMIERKDRLEGNFLERLLNDTDDAYRLSDFYKRMAYNGLLSNMSIVQLAEKQFPKSILHAKLRLFTDTMNNIEVVKRTKEITWSLGI